ncbi:MAG TPA: hypothetical protein VEU06_09785 [Micropepsaceae bacterium]|jgi:hypothetical protein|nr:hypothetical protein [Micropepsaceae bacterium]
MAKRRNGVPSSYYTGIADELDSIAEAVRKHPHLHHHFAGRLNELAVQLRQDLVLLRLQPAGYCS